MLASTVQFSKHKRPQPHTAANTHQRMPYDDKTSPKARHHHQVTAKPKKTNPHPQEAGSPFPQDPTACPSHPNNPRDLPEPTHRSEQTVLITETIKTT
jgi:hypothetical protein